jgi:hypothetical protein
MDRAHRREQIRRLLERRERQGLTYRELDRQTREPLTTLAWWSSRLRRERSGSRGFVELVPKGGSTAPGGANFEMVLDSGSGVLRKRGAAAKSETDRTTAGVAPAPRRGRPPKAAVGSGDSLKAFLAEYEELKRDRNALREALEAARRAIAMVVR